MAQILAFFQLCWNRISELLYLPVLERGVRDHVLARQIPCLRPGFVLAQNRYDLIPVNLDRFIVRPTSRAGL